MMMTIDNFFKDTDSSKLLFALKDFQAFTASELSKMCGIDQQKVDEIIDRRIGSNLLFVWGRRNRKYYRILNSEIANKVNQFIEFNQLKFKLKERPIKDKDLTHSRSCYGHLAGKTGVKICQALIDHGFIQSRDDNFTLTKTGVEFYNEMGVNTNKLSNNSKSIVKPCLDFSERKYHLSGEIGDAMLSRFLELKWFERIGKTRIVKPTSKGKIEIQKRLGIEI